MAAGASPFCRCFLRRRRWFGDGCTDRRWRSCGAAAVWGCGVQVADLVTSVEVVRGRWPQIWVGGCLGVVPGRWFFFVFKSGSSELVSSAAPFRLRAWSSSDLWMAASGGCGLRRLGRWRSSALEGLVVEDGATQQWRLCISPVVFLCLYLLLYVFVLV